MAKRQSITTWYLIFVKLSGIHNFESIWNPLVEATCLSWLRELKRQISSKFSVQMQSKVIYFFLGKIMELVKLGTTDFMYLEVEGQLEIKRSTLMMFSSLRKTTRNGTITPQRKETLRPQDSVMFSFAFTTTSLFLEVWVTKGRSMETSGYLILSKKIGFQLLMQTELMIWHINKSLESFHLLEYKRQVSCLKVWEQHSLLEEWTKKEF